MSGDGRLTKALSERPDTVHELLRKERGDCLSCKIVGSGAFFGLAAYGYFSGMSQLDRQKQTILRSGSRFGLRSRQAGISIISLSFVGLGLWRASN